MINVVWKPHLLGFAVAVLVVCLGPAMAETTKERVLREGKIVIGIHNRSPWGYRDEATGEPTGWHPDLLKAAFAELGVKELEIQVTEFGALVPGLLAGRFDAVASGLAVTPERCRQVSFGAPDLKVPDAAIVLSGNPKKIHAYADIAKKSDIVMGAGRGSVVAKNATAAGVPQDRMLLFPDIESNISALRAGRIDVAVLSSPTVIGLLAGAGAAGLERAAPFTVQEGQANFAAIAFRHEDEDLRALYDERLAQLKVGGTLAEIMRKYGFGEPETVPDTVTAEKLCGENR
ncbi:amino acid ABC transporter substrate-binding protein, PAAT family [Mesorhizobium albiziae]|uniref:Amino acid ABC transporter substrate-binding protein, PAAT family n=1 Tax=Neomesorhizobium albiziae TaxID=335020 RepID=A0A1I4EBU0_9HYPH|nr:ectoine/hydroxyectoine ABC transporter substrate-binding protein EhuB [Mesorhizobium albiziae]GLS33561.1 ectoine/hydroxyectoine ABC transporter substrate-binding protein EhuB [Mesorhizobium albiziae]SFL03284.1 amino acid ABC transporter substrate-binding protein, PAAT family [Mesorhizobium albiziae]